MEEKERGMKTKGWQEEKQRRMGGGGGGATDMDKDGRRSEKDGREAEKAGWINND